MPDTPFRTAKHSRVRVPSKPLSAQVCYFLHETQYKPPFEENASVVGAHPHPRAGGAKTGNLWHSCFYEVRPRKDKRGVDLISDALPFGRLWDGEPDAISNAVGYAKFYSRSHDVVIRVCDDVGNVIETHEHAGHFKGGCIHVCA